MVIGSGVSARDIVIQLSETANRVTLSQNQLPNASEEDRQNRLKGFAKSVIHRGNVRCLTSNGAKFVDGSIDTFTVIIYATGNSD